MPEAVSGLMLGAVSGAVSGLMLGAVSEAFSGLMPGAFSVISGAVSIITHR